jgi:hypothetical protein
MCFCDNLYAEALRLDTHEESITKTEHNLYAEALRLDTHEENITNEN